jgi:hypothetical protein
MSALRASGSPHKAAMISIGEWSMKNFMIFALLLLLFPAKPFAQTEDARIQILKGQIEGFLENQKTVAARHGCKLDTAGEITVEKANGYYALTLPDVTYTDAEGIRSDIGMVAVNAVPAPNNEWKISLALPAQISSFDKAGKESFKTMLGNQNASGVWNEKLGHFTSMNASYGNIQLHNLKDQGTANIGSVSVKSSLTEKDEGAYTGSAQATLDNISYFDTATNVKANLPKIVLNTNLADRAGKEPLTKEQIKNRPKAGKVDFFNIFSQLFGTPEKVIANVTGLDALSAQLQQSLLTAPPQGRQKLFAAVAGAAAVSAMGKPSGDPATKTYEVVFDANGNATLNGTDLGSLMKPGKSVSK